MDSIIPVAKRPPTDNSSPRYRSLLGTSGIDVKWDQRSIPPARRSVAPMRGGAGSEPTIRLSLLPRISLVVPRPSLPPRNGNGA